MWDLRQVGRNVDAPARRDEPRADWTPSLGTIRDQLDELRWSIGKVLPGNDGAQELIAEINDLLATPGSFTAPITSPRVFLLPKAISGALTALRDARPWSVQAP
jgi:hypothetical protein